MQINAPQLDSHLLQQVPLCTLLYGQDTYLAEYCNLMLKQHLRNSGYQQSHTIFFDNKKDAFQTLEESAYTQDLFAEKKILDIRIPGALTKDEKQKFHTILSNLPQTIASVITIEKLPKTQHKEKWFQFILKNGLVVANWPMSQSAYQNWLSYKAQALHISLTSEAISMLSHQTNGNVLAGYQMLLALKLLDKQTVTQQDVLSGIGAQSHYELGDLYTAILEENHEQIAHIIAQFKRSNHPIPLLLWGLHQLVQQLLTTEPLTHHLTTLAVLPKNMAFQGLLKRQLSKITPEQKLLLVNELAKLDKLFKNFEIAHTWQAFLGYCLNFANTLKNA